MSEKEKIVVIGGGGHAKVVIDILKAIDTYDVIGLIDPKLEKDSKVCGITVLGGDDQLDEIFHSGVHYAALGIGSEEDNSLRDGIYRKIKEKGYAFPVLIHPSAYVSSDTELDEGVQIMAKAVVQPGTEIGENSVINTGTVVEHDNHIGQNLYTGTNVTVSGFVTIKDNVFIGSGAVIIPKITLSENCLIAAGAVVTKNVDHQHKVKGIPAKSF